MRGLTEDERIALREGLPGASGLEWFFDDPRAPALESLHDACARRGWMIRTVIPTEDGDELEWTTTKRGRVALECDALVRATLEKGPGDG